MKTRVKKPKRPDCNSCYHFLKSDFNETEGYCRVCKKHLNPKEGEECEQFEPYSLYCDTDSMKENEFNLNSATKYEDGEPMMSDLPVQLVRLSKRIEFLEKRVPNQLDGFMKNVDTTVNSLDSKFELLDDKIHHLKDLFGDLETQINDLSIRFDEFKKFVGYILADPVISHHTSSNFCGNCCHCSHVAPDVTYRCELSGEDVDHDDSSCAMFEQPF